MLQQKDAAQLKAMSEMQALMSRPDAMKEWFASRKWGFEALPGEQRRVATLRAQTHLRANA